jgi:excisionase family DNA binding protein
MDRTIAAEYLCISVGTVDRLIADGKLKSVLVRGMPRYKRCDLDDYIDSLPAGNTSEAIAGRTPGLKGTQKKRREGMHTGGSAATA